MTFFPLQYATVVTSIKKIKESRKGKGSLNTRTMLVNIRDLHWALGSKLACAILDQF